MKATLITTVLATAAAARGELLLSGGNRYQRGYEEAGAPSMAQAMAAR